MSTPHISEQFDAELDARRNLLMEMGGLVEQQLQKRQPRR
jgi:phosphate uptake regulator